MPKKFTGFEKFMSKEPQGAKKKEQIKVEKRKSKAEARIIGAQKRKERWEQLHGIQQPQVEPKKASKYAPKPTPKKELVPQKNTETKLVSASNTYVNPNSKKAIEAAATAGPSTEMPLNKFIAHAGICGRREAAELVKQNHVTVNGTVVTEPGYKVTAQDEVRVKGKRLYAQKNLVYVLLNKPKDYITTSNDPQGRKTVLDLVKNATKERIYPVGRLDRNTTGVLLLTNDGELAQKLTHPSYEIKKVYEAKLDKPLAKEHYEAIMQGVVLEDGLVPVDSLGYVDSKDKSLIGIEIHSGKNRIVRRLFEHFGYDVKNLDRVMFANLTKKNVERSKWRLLAEKEVRLLKYMNQSFVKKKEAKKQVTQ
jgi:23S rRNA pseudouridine2605 synthase